MKYLLLFLLLPLFTSGQFYGRAKPGSVTRDTSAPHQEYLLQWREDIEQYDVRRIWVRTIHTDSVVECHTVMYWQGDDRTGKGWYSSYNPNTPKDTTDHGPCWSGPATIGSGPTTYQGDSIIEHNCWSSDYYESGALYYQPKEKPPFKNKKGKVLLGPRYELQPLDKIGFKGEWYPAPFFILCS